MTTLFVAEANGTSYALQSFFTTIAVLEGVLAAQGEMLSEAIIHQLQKFPLQTLKHAISPKTYFTHYFQFQQQGFKLNSVLLLTCLFMAQKLNLLQ